MCFLDPQALFGPPLQSLIGPGLAGTRSNQGLGPAVKPLGSQSYSYKEMET